MIKGKFWHFCFLLFVVLGLFGHFAVEAFCVMPDVETVTICQTQAAATASGTGTISIHTGFTVPPLPAISYLSVLVFAFWIVRINLPSFAASPLLLPPING